MPQSIPTYQEFVTLFPEFSELAAARFEAWIQIAQDFVIERRWRRSYNYGCYLFIAHFLTLEKMNAQAVQSAGQPSFAAAGILSGYAKQVDDVSKEFTFDASLTALENQGQWGKTDYGQRFFQLLRMIGVAPLQS